MPRSRTPVTETRAQRFERLATQRTNQIINLLICPIGTITTPPKMEFERSSIVSSKQSRTPRVVFSGEIWRKDFESLI
jgi:hypothetical protein